MTESVESLTFEELRNLKAMDGMYVGLLDDDEYTIFKKAVDIGIARRTYKGVGGFLGLAIVSVNKVILTSGAT